MAFKLVKNIGDMQIQMDSGFVKTCDVHFLKVARTGVQRLVSSKRVPILST